MNHMVAVEFELRKYAEEDYETDSQCIVGSSPELNDFFMFEEDVMSGFLETNEYKRLESGRMYWVFMVISISPSYSYSLEGGNEFDCWEWDDLSIHTTDMGKLDESEEE